MSCRLAVLGSVVLVALWATQLQARTWHIRADGSGDAPTIQSGIDSCAAFGDSVIVSAGLYNENLDARGKSIALLGAGADVTVVDGGSRDRVLAISSGLVEGLTLQHGFLNNYWVLGGAGIVVHGPPGEVVIQQCTIQNNACDTCGGGGILVVGSRPVVIRSCVIQNNLAGFSSEGGGGGGIALENAFTPMRVIIEDNLIRNNSGGTSGGGLMHYHDSDSTGAVIRSNSFIGNTTSHGGGGMMVVGPATIEANLVIDNGTGAGGGGIHAEGAAIIRNNTVVRNGSGSTAGIFALGPILSRNIVALNYGVGVLWDGSEYPDCNNIWGNTTNVAAWPGTGNGNLSADPVFCKPATADYHLADFSPCLPANNGCGLLIGALGAECTVSDVSEAELPLTALSISPNPPRSQTTITYRVSPGVRNPRLMIYDLRGRVVTRLVGSHVHSRGTATWDGRDVSGNHVSSGIYIVRLESEAGSVSRKIAWIR